MQQHFKRVLIIVLENQNYADVIGDPYFWSLAQKGASFTDFHGLFHPSYSNYLAMVSGSDIFSFSDIQRNVKQGTIADRLSAHGLTWKNYAEGYPGGPGKDAHFCYTGSSQGRYARKHVPFASFSQVQQNQCQNIVPARQFYEDLESSSLPQYAFFSPDLDDDGHDPVSDPKQGVAKAATFLRCFLDPLLSDHRFMRETLTVVTFDESRDQSYKYANHIYTVFLGDMVERGEYNESTWKSRPVVLTSWPSVAG